MQRRAFLADMIASATALASGGSLAYEPRERSQRYLRPPGAVDEQSFRARCIKCGQCGEIFPNRCIKFFSVDGAIADMGTPYITPREKACILCMKCGDACPTGALQSIDREADAIMRDVDMGHARVDERLCLSYQGKTCGVCYRACPLADVAIKIGRLEQPHVMPGCVGCGLCERSCIQIPQAIKVYPSHG